VSAFLSSLWSQTGATMTLATMSVVPLPHTT
jgi:hypothetical protein